MAIVLNIHAIYRHRLRRDLANGAAILLRPFSVNTLISLPSHLCKKMTPTPLKSLRTAVDPLKAVSTNERRLMRPEVTQYLIRATEELADMLDIELQDISCF